MGTLRLLLALSVVVAHSGPILHTSFVGGMVAVKAFYMISGFYMSLILNEKYVGVNRAYGLFISNRFLRLFPIYWVVLALTIILNILTISVDNSSALSQFQNNVHSMHWGALVFLIFTNVFLFFQDIVMFLGVNLQTGLLYFTPDFHQTKPMLYQFLFIPQAWTIGVELMFYLIAPFIVRSKLHIVLILAGLSLVLRLILIHGGLQDDPWSYRFFPTELIFFLLGNISYRLYYIWKNRVLKGNLFSPVFALILLFVIFFEQITVPGRPYIFILLFTVSLPFIFIMSKSWKVDRYIGELSYPVYICHVLIISVLKLLRIDVSNGIIVVVYSILFSIALNELISKNVEKIRESRIK